MHRWVDCMCRLLCPKTPRGWKPGKLFNGFIMTLLGWHMHPVGFHYCCVCFKFCSGLNSCLDHINSVPSLWEEAITDLIALFFFFFRHKCISNWFQMPLLINLNISTKYCSGVLRSTGRDPSQSWWTLFGHIETFSGTHFTLTLYRWKITLEQ